jgi:hypothetical protein
LQGRPVGKEVATLRRPRVRMLERELEDAEAKLEEIRNTEYERESIKKKLMVEQRQKIVELKRELAEEKKRL